MTETVLYSADAIRDAIQTVMASRNMGRRVALVAFIGVGADVLLPKPAGMEIYCWPEPSATSAKAVRKLLGQGARVFFANKLHMKVFWSERGGAVIASANLSANALGSGGLREAGVLLPRGVVSLTRLLSGVRAKPVTERMLRDLERANEAATVARPRRNTSDRRTFREALEQRRPFLIFPVTETVDPSERLKAAVKEDRPRGSAYGWLTARRNDAKEGDFILTLNFRPRARRIAPEWLFVQRKVLVARDDAVYDPENPFQVAQVFEPRLCPEPPFGIDAAFRKAVAAAVAQVGRENIEAGRPSRRVISAILRNLPDGA